MLAFDLKGGGMYVYGAATLTNSNIYSNTASLVRARLCVTFHRPIELALELTDCCARARDFGTAVCECLHFEPSAAFPPLPH